MSNIRRKFPNFEEYKEKGWLTEEGLRLYDDLSYILKASEGREGKPSRSSGRKEPTANTDFNRKLQIFATFFIFAVVSYGIMTILQQLGAQIREKRKQMGYSQELLGQFVSMDKTQISKIEKGKYKNLEKIQFVLEALEMAIVLKNEIDTIPIDAYQPLQEPIDISETIFKDYVPGSRQISETLIWDVDKSSFDAKKSANFIVERVLERGDIEDYYALFDIFGGIEPVRVIVSQIKKLNPLCENFARATFRLGYVH